MPLNVSSSKLATFRKCKYSYYAKYILLLPDISGDKTRNGSLLHELFELITHPKKFEKRKKYIVFSRQTGLLHNTIKRFMLKLWKKYRIPEELQVVGVKLAVDSFYKGFDINSKVLEVEKEFLLPLENGIFLKGFIDRVSEISEDTIELTDYKSGVPYNELKCQEEIQPFIYKIAAKILWPKYKNILFNFYFLKNKKIIHVNKTDRELEVFRKGLLEDSVKMLNFTPEKAIPSKGWWCKAICQFREPNKEKLYSGCPAFFDKNGKPLYKD